MCKFALLTRCDLCGRVPHCSSGPCAKSQPSRPCLRTDPAYELLLAAFAFRSALRTAASRARAGFCAQVMMNSVTCMRSGRV